MSRPAKRFQVELKEHVATRVWTAPPGSPAALAAPAAAARVESSQAEALDKPSANVMFGFNKLASQFHGPHNSDTFIPPISAIGVDRWNYGSEVMGQHLTIQPVGEILGCFERVLTEDPGEIQLLLFIPDAECEHFVNYVRQPAADLLRSGVLVNRAELTGKSKSGSGSLACANTRAQAGHEVTEDVKYEGTDNQRPPTGTAGHTPAGASPSAE